MSDHVTVIYYIVDESLKALQHWEDPRRTFSDAEVITPGLVAALYHGGHLRDACRVLKETGLMPNMLGESRFNRRWHAVADLTGRLFACLGLSLKAEDSTGQYRLDSFPLEVCDNIRISRARLVTGAEFRGYCAAKRRYFYGYRAHVLTTSAGVPVELAFLPGAANDVRGLAVLPLALPPGSELFMDAGFTDYNAEDVAAEAEVIRFSVSRKKNSRRRDPLPEHWFKQANPAPSFTFSFEDPKPTDP